MEDNMKMAYAGLMLLLLVSMSVGTVVAGSGSASIITTTQKETSLYVKADTSGSLAALYLLRNIQYTTARTLIRTMLELGLLTWGTLAQVPAAWVNPYALITVGAITL
jgi:hypothetical protein